ncbi:MAG: S53 family peptidase [Mycobacteriales bacterium]
MFTAVGALALLTASATAAASAAAPNKVVGHTTSDRHSCGTPAAGHVACNAIQHARQDVMSDGSTKPATSSSPLGYGPTELRSAYNLASAATAGGTNQTVAIVDAYDDPNAEADLNTYRSQYGIPLCQSSTGCFQKLNESGNTGPLPKVDAGWAQEESLDIDMVSAICPNCKIMLVEASSASYTDLGTAVNTAVSKGANVVSNSYGGGESSSETSLANTYYTHPGVAIVASAGDSGYGVEFPAAAPYVTAVGGTTLTKTSTGRGWAETVWGSSRGGSGTGSGCSSYVTKQSWQTDAGCTRRTVADVSADANPNTGVAVYDSTPDGSYVGWMQFGGTSVASPIIGAVYALAGNASTVTGASYAYQHTGSLYDVSSGANGTCTSRRSTGSAYLCTGEVGYDGPTGLGTPNGVGAF